MTNVEVRLFGSPELTVDGETARVDTRKATAILAILVVDGLVSRDTLAAMLWPESDESHARSALRRTLSALRSVLGPEAIEADRYQIRLSPTVNADIDEFRASLKDGERHKHGDVDVCALCLPDFDHAAASYRGDLLTGFSLRDAPAFDDWLTVTAATFRSSAGRVFERLAAGRASLGDYRSAGEASDRWISLDNLHEPAYRNKMLIAAWAGDRTGAIETYRRCVEVLNTELGVAPLEETSELYEAILDEDLPPAPGPRQRVRSADPVKPPESHRWLGRDMELALLRAELAASAKGVRNVLLEGNTWSGKTSLLERFLAQAVQQGNQALLARGSRSGEQLPYGVVTQLLRTMLGAGLVADENVPAWARQELAQLLPEMYPAGRPADALSESRLFEAVATVFILAATESGLLVGVDDCQWIDSSSAAMLSYVIRRLGECSVLFLFVLPTDDPRTDLRTHGVNELTRTAVRVLLGPLTAQDIKHLTGEKLDPVSVIRQTGGIPLLVAEHLLGDDLDQTKGIGLYIETMLRDLDGLSQQVLAAASVLGGSFDLDQIRGTSGRGEQEVAEALEILMTRRILRLIPGTAAVGFSLGGLETAVYGSLSPIQTRLLHGRAAAALKAEPGVMDAGHAAAIAQHFHLGNKLDQAAMWFGEAGDLAASLFATAEAADSYRSALSLEHPEPARIRLSLGDVLLVMGEYSEASDEFMMVSAVGSETQAALAEHRIGDIQRRLGKFEQAEHHFQMSEPAHPEPAELLADWALLRHRAGALEEATGLARRAVELASSTNAPRSESRARDILGIVSDDVGELDKALDLAGTEPDLRMAALNSLAVAVGEDDPERALALVEEGLELARKVGDRHREAALLNHLADLHYREGRRSESQLAQTSAVRIFAEIQPNSWEPEVWLLTRW